MFKWLVSDWHYLLPGPTGFGLEIVRRGLVQTYCEYDYTVCDSRWDRPQKYGTGILLRGSVGEEYPSLVLTADYNCGWPNQPIKVRQGQYWAYAEPVKRQKGRLALFRLYQPKRLGFTPRPANALPLGDGKLYEGDQAAMVGYHRPLSERNDYLYCPWPCVLHAEPAKVTTDWEADGHPTRLRVASKNGMNGSPIFARQAVVGIGLHWRNYPIAGNMAVADLPELKDFLQGLLGDDGQVVCNKSPMPAEV